MVVRDREDLFFYKLDKGFVAFVCSCLSPAEYSVWIDVRDWEGKRLFLL